MRDPDGGGTHKYLTQKEGHGTPRARTALEHSGATRVPHAPDETPGSGHHPSAVHKAPLCPARQPAWGSGCCRLQGAPVLLGGPSEGFVELRAGAGP